MKWKHSAGISFAAFLAGVVASVPAMIRADNVTLPGRGESVATETVSGAQYQLMIPVIGAQGSPSRITSTAPVWVRDGVPTTCLTTIVAIAASSSGDNQIVSATSSQTTRLYRVELQAHGTVTLKWRSGTTDKGGTITLVDGQPWVRDFSAEPWVVTATNEALNLNLSGAVSVTGTAWYTKS